VFALVALLFFSLFRQPSNQLSACKQLRAQLSSNTATPESSYYPNNTTQKCPASASGRTRTPSRCSALLPILRARRSSARPATPQTQAQAHQPVAVRSLAGDRTRARRTSLAAAQQPTHLLGTSLLAISLVEEVELHQPSGARSANLAEMLRSRHCSEALALEVQQAGLPIRARHSALVQLVGAVQKHSLCNMANKEPQHLRPRPHLHQPRRPSCPRPLQPAHLQVQAFLAGRTIRQAETHRPAQRSSAHQKLRQVAARNPAATTFSADRTRRQAQTPQPAHLPSAQSPQRLHRPAHLVYLEALRPASL
jgi:hypothetical protein